MRWIINIGKWSIGHGINIKLLPLLGLSSISSAPAVHGSVEPFYVDITEFTKHNPAPLPGRLSMDITEFTKRNPAPLPGRFYMDVTGELRFDPDAPNPQSRDSDYRGKSIDELGERLEFDPHSIDPDYSGKSIDELGEGLEFDRDVFESTDVDLIMRQFDLLRPMFAGDPLMEDPHVPIIELEANLELFNLFRNLSPEERELKLKERCTILCREHAERKQLEANPEMKRNADAQRKAYINWLEGLFELSDEALATKMDEMQAQLHGIDEALASQRDESTSTIPRNRRSIGSQKEKLQAQKTILQFQLNEFNTLIQLRQNGMPVKKLQTRLQWKEAIAQLPIENFEKQFHQNLNVIEEMLEANRKDPEKLSQQIEKIIERIETTIDHLREKVQTQDQTREIFPDLSTFD